MRRLVATAGLSSMTAGLFFACNAAEPPTMSGFDASLPRLPDGADAAGEPDAREVDAIMERDAASDAADAGMDAGDGNACSGRPNGFIPDGGDPILRCCQEVPVKINSVNNCGSCGIKCPTGTACGNPQPGKWGCGCPGPDSDCVAAGYGPSATCYDNGSGAFCNCQCPRGDSPCNGQCKGGARCNVVSGHNFCAYP